MNRLSLLLMAILLVGQPAFGQVRPEDSSLKLSDVWVSANRTLPNSSATIGNGSVLRPKFRFYWETRIEPAIPPMADGFSTVAMEDSTGVIHRIMFDKSTKTYFGYDVLVEDLSDPATFRVTFRTLQLPRELSGNVNGFLNSWMGLTTPRFPAPQVVNRGAILELVLLSNSSNGQKIVDYVTIQEPESAVRTFQNPAAQNRDFSYAPEAPRDITSNDVAMTIRSPRIAINGKAEESVSDSNSVSGTFVWFYIPDHGRFIISLGPHAESGFRKIGEVRGTSLSFTMGSDTVMLSSAIPIAPGLAAFNLYVVQQPDWKPQYLFADTSAFSMGAVDSFESLDK
jgi:hypothetical protein